MPRLSTGVRRRLRDKALAASRRLSTGPEWERHVRHEFGLLAGGDGWRDQVTDGFHRLYYERGEAGGTWKDTTFHGGSALYLATMCETLGGGEVVSVDIGEWPDRPVHPRLTYVVASSTDPEVVARLAERAAGAGAVLVVLDSDHSRDHVLAELRAYAPMVTPGSYLVVEDTNINGHPVYEAFGPGPMEAVQDFLKERDDFEVDHSREKFLFTFNPGGWLRKVG